MSKFLPEVIAKARAGNLPAPLVQAILNDLSGGQNSLPRYSLPAIKLITETALRINGNSKAIEDVFLIDTENIINFQLDEAAWNLLSRTGTLSLRQRLLLSCKVGVAMLPVKKLVFEGKLPKAQEAGEQRCWEHDLLDFMRNPAQQIDLFLFDLQNLGQGQGLLLAISKLYSPETAVVTNKAHDIVKKAKELNQAWEQVLTSERAAQRREAVQLQSQIKEAVD